MGKKSKIRKAGKGKPIDRPLKKEGKGKTGKAKGGENLRATRGAQRGRVRADQGDYKKKATKGEKSKTVIPGVGISGGKIHRIR